MTAFDRAFTVLTVLILGWMILDLGLKAVIIFLGVLFAILIFLSVLTYIFKSMGYE